MFSKFLDTSHSKTITIEYQKKAKLSSGKFQKSLYFVIMGKAARRFAAEGNKPLRKVSEHTVVLFLKNGHFNAIAATASSSKLFPILHPHW
jgi:hypothetical protein